MSLVVDLVSLVVLVISLIVLAQVRTLKAQMDRFANEWRTEMVELVKYTTNLANDASESATSAKELIEERASDVEAIDKVTRGLVGAVSLPFVSAGRVRLGYKRARGVFRARREGIL